MKNRILTGLLITAVWHTSAMDYGVQKIDDGFYVGKTPDDFYLAAERVTEENLDIWREFAAQQVRGVRCHESPHFLPSEDGATFFRLVLNSYAAGDVARYHELWVAYVSYAPITHRLHNPKNSAIDMYTSAITTPDALITSHMGISRTWQTAQDLETKRRRKQPGQPMHVHSFAAKVMKLRDSKKVYTLNIPVPKMREILVENLPVCTIFIGDTLYQKTLVNIRKYPRIFCINADRLESPDDSAEGRKREADLCRKCLQDWKIKECIAQLKTHQPCVDLDRTHINILRPNGELFISIVKTDPAYQWLFTNPYCNRGLIPLPLPYVLIDLEALAAWGPLDTRYRAFKTRASECRAKLQAIKTDIQALREEYTKHATRIIEAIGNVRDELERRKIAHATAVAKT